MNLYPGREIKREKGYLVLADEGNAVLKCFEWDYERNVGFSPYLFYLSTARAYNVTLFDCQYL